MSIVVQQGTGNVATPPAADNRKAGQHQGSAATAPAVTSGNASQRSAGVSPWWYVAAAVAGAVGWELLRSKWAAWWVRPG